MPYFKVHAKVPVKEYLMCKKLEELKKMAKDLNMPYRSKLNKKELVDQLSIVKEDEAKYRKKPRKKKKTMTIYPRKK